jgi:oligoendopeptidase F
MTIEINGQEYTLQQAAKFLESHDRTLREEVYRKMGNRRLQDKETLNSLYSQLVGKRTIGCTECWFLQFRDYKFVELGRFDYTKEDCYQFHEA